MKQIKFLRTALVSSRLILALLGTLTLILTPIVSPTFHKYLNKAQLALGLYSL
nr:MAG TPA: hypothetical protein [Caudoviricetes sp.]